MQPPPGVTITQYGMRCEHKKSAVRWRIRSNGTGVYAVQCCVCGSELRCVARSSPEVQALAHRMPFDEELAYTWQEQCRQFTQDRWEAQATEQQLRTAAEERERRIFYEQHLRSDKWKILRGRVMLRANGVCEGCGERKASQVHHLTYAHLGDEFLFELVAVCHACHCRIHEREVGP